MSSLFKPPKQRTSMPTPEVPAVPQVEGKEEVSKLMKKRKGRSATVLTGDLEPMDIGKRTLLG